ncbi:chromosome partitioning protein [Agromyces terreus]|uniref:Chromosome partitioning protein n=2 Tax=Agromyces terreus TaxID=424795 RepID=A0A9X2H5G8_9MICO|nr:chromosome partitioning protein [Agromyces terreus]
MTHEDEVGVRNVDDTTGAHGAAVPNSVEPMLRPSAFAERKLSPLAGDQVEAPVNSAGEANPSADDRQNASASAREASPSQLGESSQQTRTGSSNYDWDAATAAALSDFDGPAVPARTAHSTAQPDRLLEDIIREIVGDAAVDTVSSLQSAKVATETPSTPAAPLPRPAAHEVPAPSDGREDMDSPTPDASAVADATTHQATGDSELGAADITAAPTAQDSDPQAPTAQAPDPQAPDVLDPDEAVDVSDVSRETSGSPAVVDMAPEPVEAEPVEDAASTDGMAEADRPIEASAQDQGAGSSESADPVEYEPSADADIATAPPVSRETEPEYGGTPLADQIADETRRRIALETAVLPLPVQTRVFTISNQKGGVGKTTTAVNLAAALARSGAHVLVVDLDPQGNASTALGVDHRSDQQSVYEVLVADLELAAVVRPSTEHERLDCVPATIHLAGAEIELVSLVAREQRLRRAIDKHLASMDRPYDYVFIDCPPSLGLLTINAFVAAREVLIPIQCEYYALEGLSQLLSNIELIEKHLNSELRLSTILLTMYDSRTNLAQQVAQEVRDHFPAQTLETIIPRSVRVSEAPSYGQSVISYDYSSSGSLSYREAAAEIAQRAAAAAQKEGN